MLFLMSDQNVIIFGHYHSLENIVGKLSSFGNGSKIVICESLDFSTKSYQADLGPARHFGLKKGARLLIDPAYSDRAICFEVYYDLYEVSIKSVYSLFLDYQVLAYEGSKSRVNTLLSLKKVWDEDEFEIPKIQNRHDISSVFYSLYGLFYKNINPFLKDPFRHRDLNPGLADKNARTSDCVYGCEHDLVTIIQDIQEFLFEACDIRIRTHIICPRDREKALMKKSYKISTSIHGNKNNAEPIKIYEKLVVAYDQLIQKIALYYRPYGEVEFFTGKNKHNLSGYRLKAREIPISGVAKKHRSIKSQISILEDYEHIKYQLEKMEKTAFLFFEEVYSLAGSI